MDGIFDIPTVFGAFGTLMQLGFLVLIALVVWYGNNPHAQDVFRIPTHFIVGFVATYQFTKPLGDWIPWAYLVLFIGVWGLVVIRDYRERQQLRKRSIIPNFKKLDLKPYEIGLLVDGEFSDQDIMAAMAYAALHPDSDLDDIERDLLSRMRGIGGLQHVYERIRFKTDKKYENWYQNFIKNITDNVYTKAIKDGVMWYNPVQVVRFSLSVIMFFFLILLYFASQASSDDVIVSGMAWVILASIIPFLFTTFAFEFHTHIPKNAEIRRQILGYKMYIKTVEYYRVMKDEQTFREVLPLLISLGVHRDKLDELAEYVDRGSIQDK